LSYRTGALEPVRLEGRDHLRLDLPGGVLSLLYVECLEELWVGLAAGRIDRLSLSLADDRLSLAKLPPVEIGEAVSALSFIPAGDEGAEGGPLQGRVCV